MIPFYNEGGQNKQISLQKVNFVNKLMQQKYMAESLRLWGKGGERRRLRKLR